MAYTTTYVNKLNRVDRPILVHIIIVMYIFIAPSANNYSLHYILSVGRLTRKSAVFRTERYIVYYCIDFITVHRYVIKLHMAVFKSIYSIYPSVLQDSRRILYSIHIKFTYRCCYSVYILPLTTICQSGFFIYST